MIKQAYFRGLMKVAAEPSQRYQQDWAQLQRWLVQQGRDRLQQRTQDYLQQSAQKPAQQQPVQQQPVQQPVPQPQMSQQQKDRMLLGGRQRIPSSEFDDHGFYKDTPTAAVHSKSKYDYPLAPSFYRQLQNKQSAIKFAPSAYDPAYQKLRDYYESISRQNRDFYLKQGFRPPADYQYKTQFPFPNHPQKKQMMLQNQYQVNNNRGQQYNGYA